MMSRSACILTYIFLFCLCLQLSTRDRLGFVAGMVMLALLQVVGLDVFFLSPSASSSALPTTPVPSTENASVESKPAALEPAQVSVSTDFFSKKYLQAAKAAAKAASESDPSRSMTPTTTISTPVPTSKVETCWAVYDHPNLTTYTDKDCAIVRAVYHLPDYAAFASRGNPEEDKVAGTGVKWVEPNQKEGHIMNKKNAILLKASSGEDGGVEWEGRVYLSFESATIFEDWYLALVQGAANRPTLIDVAADFQRGIARIMKAPDMDGSITGLNALMQCLFQAYCRSTFLEDLIMGKINAKVKRTPLPKYIKSVTPREFRVGNSCPVLGPFRDVKTEGTGMSFLTNLDFAGDLRIVVDVDVDVTFFGRLGSATIQVVVLVTELKGDLMVKKKDAPSNRLWYGVTEMPEVKIQVLPVVKDFLKVDKLDFGFLSGLIVKVVKRLFCEFAVLPNMDDVPFFNTDGMDTRGMITDQITKRPASVPLAAEMADTVEEVAEVWHDVMEELETEKDPLEEAEEGRGAMGGKGKSWGFRMSLGRTRSSNNTEILTPPAEEEGQGMAGREKFWGGRRMRLGRTRSSEDDELETLVDGESGRDTQGVEGEKKGFKSWFRRTDSSMSLALETEKMEAAERGLMG